MTAGFLCVFVNTYIFRELLAFPLIILHIHSHTQNYYFYSVKSNLVLFWSLYKELFPQRTCNTKLMESCSDLSWRDLLEVICLASEDEILQKRQTGSRDGIVSINAKSVQ